MLHLVSFQLGPGSFRTVTGVLNKRKRSQRQNVKSEWSWQELSGFPAMGTRPLLEDSVVTPSDQREITTIFAFVYEITVFGCFHLMMFSSVILILCGTHNLAIKDSVLEQMLPDWRYVCLCDLYFQRVRASVCPLKKHICQSPSPRILNYREIIHKYVKFTIAVTGRNWKRCTPVFKNPIHKKPSSTPLTISRLKTVFLIAFKGTKSCCNY